MSEAAASPATAPPAAPAAGPAFVIAGDAGAAGDRGLAAAVGAGASAALGFDAPLFGAALAEAGPSGADPGDCGLDQVLEHCIEQGHDELFLLPFTSGFDLFRRQAFSESVARARRRPGGARIFCDEPDLCEPLPVRAFADSALASLNRAGVPPGEAHLVVVSGGQGDAADRARVYRLMRLIWEEVGARKADAAFLYCDNPGLETVLEEGEGPRLLVPAILAEAGARELFLRRVREWTSGRPTGDPCLVGDFADGHPNIAAWLQARLLRLWNSHRSRAAARLPNARGAGNRQRSVLSGPGRRLAVAELGDRIPEDLAYGPGVVARIFDTESLEKLLDRFGIGGDPVFVKVTWHGYAPGTYTDPVALDQLLTALDGRAVLLEGHSAGRNDGTDPGVEWPDGRRHRRWIREQEAEYLRRTGLQEVIDRHGAHYLNVTEAFWDGQCAGPDEVDGLLRAAGVELAHPELAGFVPRLLLDYRGAPLLSFARFKGATRLSISNLFGLIPAPLRSDWHGPDPACFASVCCDLALMYGALFDCFGMAESLNVAVRWGRTGLYRSRWGNYDLLPRPGVVTLSSGLAAADVLASRLQGHDARRSLFFGVVGRRLGLPPGCAEAPLDGELKRLFA